MKKVIKFSFALVILIFTPLILSSFLSENQQNKKLTLPYKKAGLSERQAAAHLLSRFTYGAKPGDIDKVIELGLEKWLQQQLDANLPDDELSMMLNSYDALKLSNAEVVKIYPRGGQVKRMAMKDGMISKDSVKIDKKEYKDKIDAYMQQKGFKPQRELYRQLMNQKILRAAYSNNQLQEMLTDFWFNHFNVSISKGSCAQFIPVYERDAIRPNVLGKFETLLLATAKSPAMLMYLDNFSSSGVDSLMNDRASDKARKNSRPIKKAAQGKKNKGLNENYAREVMELHTLGVDGGYTQHDVTEAARVLTGWTIYPMTDNGYGGGMKKMVEKVGENKLVERGFVHDGDFLFTPNRHDNKEKVVLGKKFSANGGCEEGVELLKMLAHHPSTAKFISRKIAVRFVNDNPSQNLIDKMAKTFMEKDGDIRQVIITMVSSAEFWDKEALREKTKSPMELAISAVRSLDADIKQPYQLYNWITKMGQKMYFYQAPTGFPDRGQYWINTGALLNRMNFGLALSSQRIPGIKINLAAINDNREPESSEAALLTYCKLIMPERDLSETIKRLTPMLNDPTLDEKIEDAAGKTVVPRENMGTMTNEDAIMEEDHKQDSSTETGKKRLAKNKYATTQTASGNNSMLAQVVGVIIGSPEFQRK